MKRIFLATFVLSCFATSSHAQSSGWTVDLAAGGVAPTGDLSGRLTAGFGVNAGVGYQFWPWFDLLGEIGFAGLGVPPSLLQEAQAPDGHGHLLTISAEPRFQLRLTRRFSGFVEGGAGWIRRNVALTEPAVQDIGFADPFYGDFSTQVQTDIVLSSTTRNAFGWNVGGGISVPLGDSGVDFFVDARYYHGPTAPRMTTFVPVTFGVHYVIHETNP